ncbi:MAG: type 4a pilus biogenesis protein PilO [Balneolaceae bacterium]
MSYAIRNTLILLVALLVIYGAGYGYMRYFQETEIERLTGSVEQRQQEYNQKRETADMLPMLQAQFTEAEEFINNYDKTIFPRNNPDAVFRFLSLINEAAGIDFNFVFNDSTITENYGIINSEINGTGAYRRVMEFINRIESSEPVQKINNVTINPVGQVDFYSDVNFSFQLNSHFDRLNYFQSDRTPGISIRTVESNHNPFYPLIRDIAPNEDNLVNVENSRLIGLSNSIIYLINQEGTMVTLRENDSVYLGRLISINVNEGNAVFRLNKGGIIEVVTLEVQR